MSDDKNLAAFHCADCGEQLDTIPQTDGSIVVKACKCRGPVRREGFEFL